MLFASSYDRFLYARPPLVEAICQLRFPTILTIGVKEPVDFQEAIRGEYPRYNVRNEQPAPRITGVGTPNPTLQQQPPVTNYGFVSEDGTWKVNLTNSFVALSTVRYRQWEDFALRLDKILAAFISCYQPAFFERLGLRYVNAFSRKAVGMEEMLWDDLIQPAFLGVLGEPDVDERATTKHSLDVEMALPDGCRMKMHAGPGLVKQGNQAAPGEVRFILDGDFSAAGKLPGDQVPARLEALHTHAVRLFQGAITREMHDAMGPTPL